MTGNSIHLRLRDYDQTRCDALCKKTGFPRGGRGGGRKKKEHKRNNAHLVSPDAIPEGPLCVGIDVHLDNSCLDGVPNVLDRGAGATVENEPHGQRLLAAELLRDVLLRVVEDDRLKIDVAGGVHAVNVAEGGGAGEHAVGHLGELLVGIPDLLGLGVEAGRIDVGVVCDERSDELV